MQGKTHCTAGMIFATAAASMVVLKNPDVNLTDVVTAFAGVMAGTVFPDIDSKSSALGRACFFLRPFQGTFHHRDKITHTPIIPVLMLLIRLLPTIPYYVSMGLLYFALGHILHLVLDTFTDAGIRWTLMRPISFRHKKTGSFFEPVVGVFLSCLFSAGCIIMNIV